ncbi:deoxyribonuclease-1-like isoform X2 [Lampris incognitus]|uniref:deoxyribonuclease-1-like isoform X2 n=1 Tax=Lampris incognitus TaxID=2546036 RepID=UPI0024B54007|nr:deoxyribonuclease-1-like isoform X2 [Lampris incognitus]
MRWYPAPPLLLLLSLLLGRSWGQSPGFRICAFNVQNFNDAKASDARIVHVLIRIVSRCDIILLQEVKDPQGSAIKTLLVAVNRYDDKYTYQSVSSKGLGNSANDMQQYVFLYREEMVSVMGQHQYQKNHSFIREPFAVHFHSKRTAIRDFVLVPLHTAPHQAVQEIDRLYDVYEEITKKWKTQNVMFLGDFNAGCAHMTHSNRKQIRLYTKKGFYWLIGDKVDTVVYDTTDCPYDRIVVHGTPFLKTIKPASAKVFKFSQEFKLPMDRVLKVSDHYPVEVELRSSAHLVQTMPLVILLGLSVIVQASLKAL